MEQITIDHVKSAVLGEMKAGENNGDMDGDLHPLSDGFYRLRIIPAVNITEVLARYEDWKAGNDGLTPRPFAASTITVIGTAVAISGTEH